MACCAGEVGWVLTCWDCCFGFKLHTFAGGALHTSLKWVVNCVGALQHHCQCHCSPEPLWERPKALSVAVAMNRTCFFGFNRGKHTLLRLPCHHDIVVRYLLDATHVLNTLFLWDYQRGRTHISALGFGFGHTGFVLAAPSQVIGGYRVHQMEHV